MSYQNDPNINRRENRKVDREPSYAGWIIGGLITLALVIGLFAMFGRDKNPTTATNTTTRPAATATTGSGSAGSAMPANPNGTAPQRDSNPPATTPAPATPR
jgi:hypothetical protein